MCFAIRQPSANECSGAGSIAGVEHIDVERNCKTSAAGRSDLDRIVHDVFHAALVDLSHREEAHAEFLDQISFTWIDVACADVRTQSWIEFWCKAGDVREFGCAEAEERGERHAVNVA